MNNDNKTLNQTQNQVLPQAVIQPVQSVAPVGSVNKEVGPIVAPVSEFIKPTETEPQISQELKDMGVVERKDALILDNSHKSIGIQHSGTSTPIQTAPTGKITLPMSEDEVADKLKSGQDDDSGKWLAALIKKIIAVMKLKIS